MRIAFDTSILVYAEGVNGLAKQQAALDLIGRLRDHDRFVPVQVLGELFNVLVRKAFRSRAAARDAVTAWRDLFSSLDTSATAILAAIDLSVDHHLAIWDAVIFSVAAESGCRMLLSEDLRDGFSAGGVTIINPFAATRHTLLVGALQARRE